MGENVQNTQLLWDNKWYKKFGGPFLSPQKIDVRSILFDYEDVLINVGEKRK